MATVPKSVSDTFIHTKNGSKTERILLPFTRYRNVLNAPKVVTSPDKAKGREFSLYTTYEDELTTEEITAIVGASL